MNRYRSPLDSIFPRGSVHSRRNTVRLQSNRLCILFGVNTPAVVFAAATVWVAEAAPERASWPVTARHAAGMASFQANLLILAMPDRTRIPLPTRSTGGAPAILPAFCQR